MHCRLMSVVLAKFVAKSCALRNDKQKDTKEARQVFWLHANDHNDNGQGPPSGGGAPGWWARARAIDLALGVRVASSLVRRA